MIGGRRRHGLARVGQALVLAVGLLLHGIGPALAHAALLDATPADQSRLDDPPAEASLTFNEPVMPVAMRLMDEAGRLIAGPEPSRVENATLHLALPPALGQGSYILSYRVTSADGHLVGGSTVFAIGAAAMPAASMAPMMQTNGWLRILIPIQGITAAALLAAAGGALFLLLLMPAPGTDWRLRRWLLLGAGIGVLGALLTPGVEGAMLAGTPATGLLDPGTWRLGLASSTGHAALAALLGLLLMGLGLLASSRVALGLGAVLTLCSFLLTGHAATAPPRWLALPALALHVTGIAWWLGSLVPLLLLLRSEPSGRMVRHLRRFSAIALPLVVLLLLAGTVLAGLQLRSFGALVTTSYGLLLLLKLVGVALLLGLAALNKLRLTPALARGEPRATRRLGHSIWAEIGCAVAIIAVTAVLGETPPPRTAMAAAAAVTGRQIALDQQGYHLALALTPGRPGHNRIAARLTGPDGRPVTPMSLSLAMALPAAAIEPITRPLALAGDGSWTYEGHEMALAGGWRLRIEALIDDFTEIVFDTEVQLR
jgi:copper transport protein